MMWFLNFTLSIPNAIMLPRPFPDLASCLKVAKKINADRDYPGLMYCATSGEAPEDEEPKTGT